MDNQPMSRKAPPTTTVPSVLSSRSSGRSDQGAETAPKPATRRAGRKADDPVSLGLRKLWENVEKEPVPDSMLALLDAIDAAHNAAGAKDGDANAPPLQSGDGA
jgi:hypothetical protein